MILDGREQRRSDDPATVQRFGWPLKPDLNTSFRQAVDIRPLLAKFTLPWHYASGGRGVLQRVLAAVLPAVAQSA